MMPSLRRLLRHERGVAAIEFAMLLPILLLFALPIYDITQMILIRQKINKTSASLADMLSMSEPTNQFTTPDDIRYNPFYITRARIQNIISTAPFLMTPYTFDQAHQARVDMYVVHKPVGGPPQYRIRATYTGGGVGVSNSTAAVSCNNSTTRATFCTSIGDMYDNEGFVAIRVQYRFIPVVSYFGGGGLFADFRIPGLTPQLFVSDSVYSTRRGPLLGVRY